MKRTWLIPLAGGIAALALIACTAADVGDDEGYGGGSDTGGPGVGSGTVSTKGTSVSGATTSSGPGAGPGGQTPSPDPIVEFVPAECAELDQSQPTVLYLSA